MRVGDASGLATYVDRVAPRYNIDPQAALAVASQEGLGGGIGDHGTSFGPWQLHHGGSLPANQWRGPYSKITQRWAWSNKGVDYALSRMADSGAAGLRGPAAVNAIVRNFERPANPDAEIAGADRAYGQAVTTSSGTGSSGGIPTVASPFNPNDTKPTKIDQGVDYSSKSPYMAVAPGRIVHIDPNFYNGTAAVYEKLDKPITVNGRKYTGVYYAETQPLVHVGQHVNAGQNVIASGNAEIGFAKQFGSSAGSWLPAAHGQYDGKHPTQAGQDFATFAGALGKVYTQTTQPPNPENSLLNAVASPLESVASFLEKLGSAAFWIRAMEVVGGGLLIMLGLYLLVKQIGLGGFDVPVPQKAKESADDATGTVTPHQNAPAPRRRVVNQYYLDTPSGQTRRTRALAARGASRESDDIPF